MGYYLHWHNLRYEAWRRVERAQIKCAWMLPRWLVKWAAIRMMANATTGKYATQVVPDLTAMDALKRWDEQSA